MGDVLPGKRIVTSDGMEAVSATFSREPASVPAARCVVRAAVVEWNLPGLIDVVETVTSELVTNAGKHARRESFRMTLRVSAGQVQVAVIDLGRELPQKIIAGDRMGVRPRPRPCRRAGAGLGRRATVVGQARMGRYRGPLASHAARASGVQHSSCPDPLHPDSPRGRRIRLAGSLMEPRPGTCQICHGWTSASPATGVTTPARSCLLLITHSNGSGRVPPRGSRRPVKSGRSAVPSLTRRYP